ARRCQPRSILPMRAPTTSLAVSALAALVLVGAGCSRSGETSSSVSTAVEPLNSLRRGELSAVETYRQAIEKEGSAAGDLSALRADHEDAADRLRQRILAVGGIADATSGIWGD